MDLEERVKNEELIRDLINEQVSKSNQKLQNEVSRHSWTPGTTNYLSLTITPITHRPTKSSRLSTDE
jgi:hypothetical protein